MDVIEQTNIDDIYDPVMDVAISSAILKQVSAGDLKETIRLFKPRRTLAFAPRDIRDPNYEKAVNLAIEPDLVSSSTFAISTSEIGPLTEEFQKYIEEVPIEDIDDKEKQFILEKAQEVLF